MAQEFLPFCDILFNIISLASYFCDVVFDIVTVYTLYVGDQSNWFLVSLSCIMISLLVSQLMSLKWYFHRSKSPNTDLKVSVISVLHLMQFGVLWRYFKLFLPVDLGSVKNEVRDLCMLRLVHSFCEAAPMLLIQSYLIWLKPSFQEVSDLNVVSTLFSLFSVCWALASFSKNVRHRNIHRLVLTWLGVIFQFCWRVGTISSRIAALTVYATLYHYWVFLVMLLHWLSMLLWLVSPKHIFHGENISLRKRTLYSFLIAFVYIFCYINLQEINSRPKMTAYYVTMFLENSLLMAVFLVLGGSTTWFHGFSVAVVWGGFSLGVTFMILYYRFFHIQRLKHNFSGVLDAEHACQACSDGTCTEHQHKQNMLNPSQDLPTGDKTSLPVEKFKNSAMFCSSNGHFQNGMASGIPGVFNCRLNPAFNRKKKKPSSFVPPPASVPPLNQNGKLSSPFWKKPPVKTCSSDHESSVGSRVNIQQKLQEKKQQQLQDLKEIEEEIKQGKLKRPHLLDIKEQDTLRQPIPQSKKQPWVKPESTQSSRPMLYHSLIGPHILSNGLHAKTKQRSQTPEILLIPENLDNSDMYYDYQESHPSYMLAPPHVSFPRTYEGSAGCNRPMHPKAKLCPRVRTFNPDGFSPQELSGPKCYQVPSDLDSQISLPRSYTLPREFRYYRRPRQKKTNRTEHFIPSNNSSDGDVDSADDDMYLPFANNQVIGHVKFRPYQQPYRAGAIVTGQLHETKL